MHLSNTHPDEFTKVQLEKESCKRKSTTGMSNPRPATLSHAAL